MSELISSVKNPASVDEIIKILNHVGRKSSRGLGPRSLAEYDAGKGLRFEFSYSTTAEIEKASKEMEKIANVNSIAADQTTLRVWCQFTDKMLVELMENHPWLSNELEDYYVENGKLIRGKHLLQMA